MPVYSNADTVVCWGYWRDEVTWAGVKAGDQPATVTFDPVPLTGSDTPNLRDTSARGWLKTRQRVARVDPATGYFAVLLVANNDPDLDAYGGRRVTFSGETPFVVEVPWNTPTVAADAAMVAALKGSLPGLTVGASVKAVPLIELGLLSSTPTPPASFLTTSQTLNAIATAIDIHDNDPWAHAGPDPGWRTQRVASSNMSGHRLVVPTSTGSVEYADRLIAGHRTRPIWLTLGAASSGAHIDLQMAGSVTEPSWSWAAGALYLSTDGQLTQTVPTAGFLAQVGYATSSTSLWLERQPSITLAPA